MRMWMVNPEFMCRKHLLGEHVELHMLVGHINKGRSIDGFIKNNLIEPQFIHQRHDSLVKEMFRRGYKHQSPLVPIDIDVPNATVDVCESMSDLLLRCFDCCIRYQDYEEDLVFA
jgi:hypothetical protein